MFIPILVTIILLITILYKLKRRPPKKMDEEFALNIIVNKNLKMSKGKVISQACHATAGVIRKNTEDVLRWETMGEAKIILRATEAEMNTAYAVAKSIGVPTYRVFDAGRTQIKCGSNTVVAIGPAKKSVLDAITGHLKLY